MKFRQIILIHSLLGKFALKSLSQHPLPEEYTQYQLAPDIHS